MNYILENKKEIEKLFKSIRRVCSTLFAIILFLLFCFYCYGAYAPQWDKVACTINFVHKQAKGCSYTLDQGTSFNRHIDKCFYSVPGVVEKDPTVSPLFSEMARKQFHLDGVAKDDWIWKCLLYEVKNNKLTNNIRLFDSFHCYFFNFLQYITPKPREWVVVDIG